MKILVTLFALALTTLSLQAANEDWVTDLNAAFSQAKKENKSVLVEFTGSDWCPPCKMMRKKVFSKKEFTTVASKDFILVELDFPKSDKALYQKNEPFAQQYKVTGFPTVILFDAGGKEYDRFYASAHPSIDQFLAHLDSVKK